MGPGLANVKNLFSHCLEIKNCISLKSRPDFIVEVIEWLSDFEDRSLPLPDGGLSMTDDEDADVATFEESSA